MLIFTNQHGQDIGDNSPQDADSIGILGDYLIIIYPAVEFPGVDTTADPVETAGVCCRPLAQPRDSTTRKERAALRWTKLLLKETKKGFVENIKMDFLSS